MHSEHKEFLEKRHSANEWLGRGTRSRRVIKDFDFDGSEIHGWTLERVRRDERAKPPVIRSIWRHGESTSELLSVDVFICVSVKAAHDQLIEALGNFESDAIERQTEKNTPGEIAFALGDTMLLFARVNLVVLIRNAGFKVVSVRAAARGLDSVILGWEKGGKSRQ
jgi:hypothetical protein